jgi:cytochrome c2
MIKAGEEGLVWNSETLNSFIENPKKLIAKT